MNVGERKTIQNGKTGILVKPSEWSDALEDLILNKDKRKTLSDNAYNDIKDNWQYDSSISDIINKVVKA